MAPPNPPGEPETMNHDERRALWVSVGLLLLASVVRFGWEARPVPPLLPPDSSAYATLLPAVETAVVDEARRRLPLAPGERLDVNRVDAVELARLPGVGPALSERIVAFRDTRGWIHAIDDLLEVPGIGAMTLERLRPHLQVEPPPAAWAPPREFPGSAVMGADFGASPLRLNEAGLAQLERLPGIGPALAARIVQSRNTHGPFATVEDLTRVRGVGPVLLERIRPLVTVP
jgi:competence ComEA-like helix-hairpin-helix protein